MLYPRHKAFLKSLPYALPMNSLLFFFFSGLRLLISRTYSLKESDEILSLVTRVCVQGDGPERPDPPGRKDRQGPKVTELLTGCLILDGTIWYKYLSSLLPLYLLFRSEGKKRPKRESRLLFVLHKYSSKLSYHEYLSMQKLGRKSFLMRGGKVA